MSFSCGWDWKEDDMMAGSFNGKSMNGREIAGQMNSSFINEERECTFENTKRAVLSASYHLPINKRGPFQPSVSTVNVSNHFRANLRHSFTSAIPEIKTPTKSKSHSFPYG